MTMKLDDKTVLARARTLIEQQLPEDEADHTPDWIILLLVNLGRNIGAEEHNFLYNLESMLQPKR